MKVLLVAVSVILDAVFIVSRANQQNSVPLQIAIGIGICGGLAAVYYIVREGSKSYRAKYLTRAGKS